MMENAEDILFHGSNTTVEKPIIQISGYYKDFGYGFYCTRLEKQAIRWALTKQGQHIVNQQQLYSYNVNRSSKCVNNLSCCSRKSRHGGVEKD